MVLFQMSRRHRNQQLNPYRPHEVVTCRVHKSIGAKRRQPTSR